jgi:DNA-binding protein H-NS
MASVNVDKLSLKELLDLEAKVQKAIAGARERERAEVKHAMAALAEKRGFSMSELFGGRGRGKISATKYANPDNRAETWTGRGRKPNWLVAKLNKGAKMTDFAI